ncbi:hypothetical protein C0J52_27668, partial [Blattella germanica]
ITDSSNLTSSLHNSSSISIQPQHQRLTKRPSVDSGIHLGFDRSMSLPLNSPMSGIECSYDSGSSEGRDGMRHSPVRRMDFALCEVATGPRSESPIIDVEAVSDEESEAKQSVVGQLLTTVQPTVWMCLFLSSVWSNDGYYDVGTPSSSLSPASSSCLQSPCSFTLDSPSPPPTTADFYREQRELYEAAKIIQKAYRSYKGRKKLEEQDKERAAAILIQNYYRRYKQYAYFKQMTRAAMVIQNGFRSYCEHKRFKKSQEAAVCIQNYYRNYREQGGRGGSREGTPNNATSMVQTSGSGTGGTSSSGLKRMRESIAVRN